MVVFFFVVSILCGFGFAVTIAEKGDEWPVQWFKERFRTFLGFFIHINMTKLVDCTVCLSFWTALISDLLVAFVAYSFFGVGYFLWPISGFITLGLTWFIIEFLNTLEGYKEGTNRAEEDEDETEELLF